MSDPVEKLEHAHGHLNKRLFEVALLMRAAESRLTAETWAELGLRLATLRDALLEHFADEEEALFPFIRARVPSKADSVDRLEAAHDVICSCIARMAHLASGPERFPLLATVHERFEATYVRHSGEESKLFEELGTALGGPERAELGRRLRGLR